MDTAPSEDGLTDVVKTVHWRYEGKDGEYTAEVYGAMACATPSATDFTAYADLKIELDDAEMDTPRNEYIRTHRHDEDKPVSNSPTCWGTLQDEEFSPAFTSVSKVPAGIYEIVWNRQLSQHTLKKQPFKTDELYQLPSYEIMDILKDIQNFWDRREKYKEYNFVHKRGILMYGEPGCGKSGIIQLISQQLIDNDGIIINIKDHEDVDYFTDFQIM